MELSAKPEAEWSSFLLTRFPVPFLILRTIGEFRGLRAATGALPLDPAAFEKTGETFVFLA